VRLEIKGIGWLSAVAHGCRDCVTVSGQLNRVDG